MITPDDLAAQLPARRDDEPANLRQDIVDELGDHLACAVRREQLMTGSDPKDAARRAIQRFGDPVRIARRLWKDALWEKIMSQRMLVAACSAMVLICCAALGVMWKWLDRQEQGLAAWQASNQEQMREQRELFERLMETSRQEFSEWNPVELTFVSEEDKKPVQNVNVSLRSTKTGSDMPELTAESDEQGRVRFANVHYGTYSLKCNTPLRHTVGTLNDITIPPGEGYQKLYVVPSPLNPVDCKVRVNWPAELDADRIRISFSTFGFMREVEGQWWEAQAELVPPPSPSTSGSVAFDRHGLTRWKLNTRAQLPDTSFGITILREPDDSDASQRMIVTWPDIEFRPRVMEVLVSLKNEAELPIGLPNVTIPISINKWSRQLESGSPATLVFTPDEESVARVRELFTVIDQNQEKIAKWINENS